MLILTRKSEQSILIAPDITITVLEVQGKYVRIGIDAPTHINIVRTELLKAPKSTLESLE